MPSLPQFKWTTEDLRRRGSRIASRGVRRLRRAYDAGHVFAREWLPRSGFRAFYSSLPDRRNVFFMVFPSGYMHWLDRTLGCIPPDVNLVLVGMGLSAEECGWVQARTRRPFFHIPVRVDDQTVWQWLFDVAEHDFGWLDMDLFVLNPEVLTDMMKLPHGVSVNSAWSYRCPWGIDILSTHLLVVNVQVIRLLRARGCRASPVVHTYEGDRLGRFYPHAHNLIPTPRELELLGRVLPAGPNDLPRYPSAFEGKFWFKGFDTMVVFQLLGKALGYELNRVRELDGISGSDGHYSSELLHIGALSYYEIFANATGALQRYYRLLLQFDYLVLRAAWSRSPLPGAYRAREARLRRELDRLGLPVRDLCNEIRRYFSARRVDEAVFNHPALRDLWP